MTLHRSRFRLGIGPSSRFGGVWNPKRISGLILWLDADPAYITETGSGVSTWLDRSAAGNNAIQTTDADRPAFLPTGGVNGLGGVEFDSANTEFLEVLGISDASTNRTVIAVLDQDSFATTTQALICYTSPAGTCGSFVSTLNQKLGGYDGTSWRETSAPKTGEQYLEWHWDNSGTLDVYRDGSAIGSGSYAATSISGAFKIGRHRTAGIYYLNAIVSELIIFNRILSAAELALVRAYIEAKYAL